MINKIINNYLNLNVGRAPSGVRLVHISYTDKALILSGSDFFFLGPHYRIPLHPPWELERDTQA